MLEMEDKIKIEELKKEYDKFKRKHNLPEFSELIDCFGSRVNKFLVCGIHVADRIQNDVFVYAHFLLLYIIFGCAKTVNAPSPINR